MKRFWDKVRVGTLDECWPWQAARLAAGYGRFYFDGRVVLAHRLVAHWALGVPVDGVGPGRGSTHVLHACDNPPCCNPLHLWVGTPLENTRDMMSKGRDNFLLRDPEIASIVGRMPRRGTN